MIEVVLKNLSANHIMNIVEEMKQHNFRAGNQFDFEYHASNYNEFSGDASYNRYTIFRFYNEELASWFALKYGEHQ